MTLANEVGELFAAWGKAAQVGLVVAQPDGTVVYASAESQTLSDVRAGDHLLDLFVSSDVADIEAGLRRLCETGRPIDRTANLSDGITIARFVITTVTGDEGEPRAIIAVYRDITAQGLHERRLEYEVDHDDLTGVLSRAAAIRKIEERYRSEIPGSGAAIGVLFVDLDDFKGVNDGYGHLAGDEVLKVVAKRLKNIVGDAHDVARIGGDEFLIVLGSCRSVEDAVAVAEVVEAALARPITVDELSIPQRFSVGVAVDMSTSAIVDLRDDDPPPAVRVEHLLAEADIAMYVAKHAGVSIAVANESTRTWSTRRLVIDRDLPAALQTGAINFFYQPIAELEQGRWMAAEALMRWHHPELGMLPPELVIERAEVIGCIDDLTRYAIDRIARDWANIIRRAPVMFHHQVSINASARQLSWEGYVAAHLEALERVQLTPEHLLIEVTESSRIELHHAAAETLNELAEHGVRVCLDDFGVGYSALSYFTQFTVHAVKVDRSLVSELRSGASVAEKLLRGVVRIADDLGARVVGEGIENEAGAAYCRSLGMAVGQGWYFGHPLPAEEFAIQAVEKGMHRDGDHVVLPGDPQITTR